MVWQCLLHKPEDLSECNPQNPREKLDTVVVQLVIPAPGRQRHADPCNSLAGQPSLLGELQARERVCFKTWGTALEEQT